tara:strand:+ start:120 stop:404 length:285 start_codon:yes stop_codon:yes gene_type:complete
MNLPDGFPHKPPKGYSYEVKEHKRNMVSIWLRNHATFSYTSDPVRTIWGFYNTKKGCYHAPINSTKHGDQVDIEDTRDYTAMQLNLNPLMRAFL